MDRTHLNRKHMENANRLQEFVHKLFKMCSVCTDTCLETLSALVNCSVNNVLSEIGPYHKRSFGSLKTPNKQLETISIAEPLQNRQHAQNP